MVDCPICDGPLKEPVVECSSCGVEMHKRCAKKLSGKWYCKDCKKQGKKESRYEKMAKRDRAFNR